MNNILLFPPFTSRKNSTVKMANHGDMYSLFVFTVANNMQSMKRRENSIFIEESISSLEKMLTTTIGFSVQSVNK